MSAFKDFASGLIGKVKENRVKIILWAVGLCIALAILFGIGALLIKFGAGIIAFLVIVACALAVGYKLFQGFPAIFGASVQVIAVGMVFAGILLIGYANDRGSEIQMDVAVLDSLLREKMGFSSEMAQAVAQLAGAFSSMGMIVFSILIICAGLCVGLMGELVSATAGMVIYGQMISDKLGKLDKLDNLRELDNLNHLKDLYQIDHSTRSVANEIDQLGDQVAKLTLELERVKEARLTEVN